MAALTIVANKVSAPRVIEQETYPTSVVVTAGQAVRFDTTSGQWVLATTDVAGNCAHVYIALTSAGVGQPVTAIKQGLLNLGIAMDGIALGASVFLNPAGALGDAAGVVSVIAGIVVPAFGSGANVDRLLRVDLPA